MRISDWSSDVCSSDLAVQLFFDDAFPGGLAGAGGARHAKYQCVVGGAREGVGLQGGTADFQEGQMPEQLAEACDDLIEQRGNGGGSRLAVRESGAAIGHVELYGGVGAPCPADLS